MWDTWAADWAGFMAALLGLGMILRLIVTGLAAVWHQWFCTLREL